jgi:predicted SAM-dependent methyltransferase
MIGAFVERIPRLIRRVRDEIDEIFRRKRLLLIQKKTVEDYLSEPGPRKLQIGAWNHRLEGWLNTDLWPDHPKLVHLDAAAKFPLPEASFNYVYSEHVIEHLPFSSGRQMLRESFRILKPGGKIRIATPDLQKFLDMMQAKAGPDGEAYLIWAIQNFVPDADHPDPLFVLNNLFRNWGHQFLYTEECLRRIMDSAGFREITRHPVGGSGDSQLQGIEGHGHTSGSEAMNRFETMVLEAVKPAG